MLYYILHVWPVNGYDSLDAGLLGGNELPWSPDKVCVIGAQCITIRDDYQGKEDTEACEIRLQIQV